MMRVAGEGGPGPASLGTFAVSFAQRGALAWFLVWVFPSRSGDLPCQRAAFPWRRPS
jgi:hypothetical protein